jgi:hypothetical protein
VPLNLFIYLLNQLILLLRGKQLLLKVLYCALHSVGVESHITAADVIGHFSIADETFALISMYLFETLLA